MRADDRHFVERQGVALVQARTVSNLRWLFREQSVSDVGVDAQLEIVVDGQATGRLLALQSKSGDSYFRESVSEGDIYRGDQEHLHYWLNHSLPVVVVICKPDAQEAYWQVVAENTIVKTVGGWKMVIPKVNQFCADAKEALAAVAAGQVMLPAMGGAILRPEGLTSSDAILGKLLADPELLARGRSIIQTASIAYTCTRIASLDNLLAILVTSDSADGTVFVLRREENAWAVAAQLSAPTKYADFLPAFFVPGASAYCFVLRHPTSWGTGTLLYEEKWYLLSEEPRLVLEYPIEGYVVGWGLLFDREIEGECTILPTALHNGACMELAIRVKYPPNSKVDKYESVSGFEVTRVISLEWEEPKKGFSALPGSDMSPEETLGLYADDDASFVARNLATLVGLAERASGGLLSWLEDLAERSDAKAQEVLCQALEQRTV